jgi:NADH:ubiquinone oxidoreductase subunit 5 (subunit L)/multisubunit Na+/H+ antiporter MnhA subunit
LWEGVGVTSFLLINFRYSRLAASKAAISAIIFNRVGDRGYSLGMFLAIALFCTLDLPTLFSTTYLCSSIGLTSIFKEACNILTLLLLIGVIGKSAQLGLHIWLVNAMEGKEKRKEKENR